ncbi:condensation domain-containing protein [Tengunoibacter tsumagoiensis]|uniref:Condensation domain-containing protein n=1 Tax=Tengunoibacter tsumagoiensis TaxID=2014871 RepID=A0A402A9B2_9CHLR|nr:condensation domain-containing protein [Tengunoibacter tsumagoiensis]GCE15719.1 hypothetical protein KTT_55780 [Tengunoibacter tsumagoiensis]
MIPDEKTSKALSSAQLQEITSRVLRDFEATGEEAIVGSVPYMTVGQKKVLKQFLSERCVWKFFQLNMPLEPAVLAKTLAFLFLRFDTLRLRVRKDETGWHQFIAPITEEIPLKYVNLAGMNEDEKRTAINKAAQAEFRDLHQWKGPLIRIVHFLAGEGQPDLLLILIHHFTTDITSDSIFYANTQKMYFHFLMDKPFPRVRPAQHSFQRAMQDIVSYVREQLQVEQEIQYWLSLPDLQPLAVDFPEALTSRKKATTNCVLSIQFNQEEAETFQAIQKHVPVLDLLLAALAIAFQNWSGRSQLLISVPDNGRAFLGGKPLTGVLGYFTILRSLFLQIEPSWSLDITWQSIQKQIQAIPHQGLGLSLLGCYGDHDTLPPKITREQSYHITFNYWGVIPDDEKTSEEFFQVAHHYSPLVAPEIAEEDPEVVFSPPTTIRFDGHIEGDELIFQCFYDAQLYRATRIESFIEYYKLALISLLHYIHSAS